MAVVAAQAVAHWATDREIAGLNPTGGWAFFLFLFSFLSFNQRCVLNQVTHGGATLLVFDFPINS